MSTLPPNHRGDTVTAPAVGMAVATTTTTVAKAKPASKVGTAKPKTQTHRRSRTGCYTCRLRRKKCDEGLSICTACKHLGLNCEYKRPVWWGNNESRKRQKEDIKVIIKKRKLSEKSSSSSSSHNHGTTSHGHHLYTGGIPPYPPHSQASSMINSPPPGLSHSLPTSATFSDPLDRTRSASIDSHFPFSFNSPPVTAGGLAGLGHDLSQHNPFAAAAATTLAHYPDFVFGGAYSPYEIVDVKTTERQTFINDVPTHKESTTATYSSYPTPPPPPPGSVLSSTSLPASEASEWMERSYMVEERRESIATQESYGGSSMTSVSSTFDFPGYEGPDIMGGFGAVGGGQVAMDLDDQDQWLLAHFVAHVLPTMLPILEVSHPGSVSSHLILPALQHNKGYLHCCLSIAALHYKDMIIAANGADVGVADPFSFDQEKLNEIIMKHRYATISSLTDALTRDENHQQTLEAALGLILFQCCVGRADDLLPDIPWHQHFLAAVSLVQKLELERLAAGDVVVPVDPLAPPPTPSAAAAAAVAAASAPTTTPFDLTLTAWIDILGATVLGRVPAFAHFYREKHLSATNPSLGLRDLMGCEDRVMYLISEIACLEALKRDGMDDITLCQHVHVLGDQIGLTELRDQQLQQQQQQQQQQDQPFTKTLTQAVTDAFRLAARIYLCSLVPGFHPSQASCIGLADKLAAVLATIPAGPAGFDRSLGWVFLVGGSVAGAGSALRTMLEDRLAAPAAESLGSLGRAGCLLREVWFQADQLLQESHQRQQQRQKSNEGSPAAASPAPAETTTSVSAGSSPSQMGGVTITGDPALHYVHWRDVMHMKGWDFLFI